MPIARRVDQNFFKTWGKDMAYVLGFFAADGTMRTTNRGTHFIEFHITDKELLYSVRATLKSDHAISERKRAADWKLGYRLQIGSKELYSDLTRLGFTPRKSHTMTFPDVPKKYFSDFVRGYFDGDGCVYFKQHLRSDRDVLTWVFTTRFTSGSKAFLSTLQQRLQARGLQGGYVYAKKRGFELVFSRKDSLALYKLMYNNTPHALELVRKRIIFEQAIMTLWK